MKETPTKLVLHFWSPTCVECLWDIDHLKKLGKALPLIGVVTPRFSFESKEETISDSVARLGIYYTIGIGDRDLFGWFNVKSCHYLVIADCEGTVLYEQLGGGGYYWLENALKDCFGVELGGRVARLLGDLELADSVSLHNNDWYAMKKPWRSFRVEGHYELKEESLRLIKAHVEFHYRGRRLYALLSPEEGPKLVKVKLNGRPLRSHLMGDDIVVLEGQTYIRLDVPRLYNIVDGGWGEYRLSLDVESPCEIYALIAR